VSDVTARYGITNAFAPPPTERAKRGITFALRDEIAAIRLMPIGNERDEANRAMNQIIKEIRDLEPRLLGDYFREREPRECHR
jgi:hypothetical protein